MNILSDEIAHTIESLRTGFETLAVRGLRAAGPDDLAQLRAAREEFERIGATHLAERIAAVTDAVATDNRAAAPALLRALASLRLFDRILTLETAAEQLETLARSKNEPNHSDTRVDRDEV